jgi:4-diphosphocytidyl-2-C-methyl-D-erythritol kinase
MGDPHAIRAARRRRGVSGAGEARIEVAAPAKLNLGLEVIGRRDDGFHEIATIFVAIDLYDRLIFSPSNDLELTCDDDALAGRDNLAFRALQVLREETEHREGARIELSKRIPAAAGLGGGSSDAAAALIGGRDLWRTDVSEQRLHELASRLGSDVPFFLRGGCAVGRGRGNILNPLPAPQGLWFVVAVPDVKIPRKTASLFAFLSAEDFSDGSRIAAQAARLAAGLPLDEALLGNALARPLYALVPRLSDLRGVMQDAGATTLAISGAGPAHYAVVNDPAQAEQISTRVRERLGDRAQVVVASPAPARH